MSWSSQLPLRWARRLPVVVLALLAVEFLDELAAGVPASGAEGIRGSFATGNLEIGALLTAFGLLAVVLEPPLFLLADHHPRRWFVCGGLFGLGLACFLAAAATNYWILFAALLLFGPASGCGVSLSQATLVDRAPGQTERTLTVWTLTGAMGDLATPILMAVCLSLGVGWRGAFVACGLLACSLALVLWRPLRGAAPSAETEPSEADPPRPLQSLRTALRSRTLLIWACALVACSLLDETFVAFFVLYATQVLELPETAALAVVAAVSGGGIVALALSARSNLYRKSDVALRLACAVSLLGLTGLLLTTTFALLLTAGFLLGAGVGLQYPLAKARLYRAFPGRSGTALAVAGLFAPIELALPLAIGWTADRFGLDVALLLLGLQPLLLLIADLLTTAPDQASAI